MAMSMQELFYGQSEPAYFAHFARQAGASSVPYYSQAQIRAPVSFHLMVPMCCTQCEDEVRDALFAMGSGVRDVFCDARNQRVTVTASAVDPAQALKQVRRVKRDAAFWSDCRHEAASSCHQNPRRAQRSGTSSSADAYARSFCPAYRDTAKTYYIRLNPRTATVEESEF